MEKIVTWFDIPRTLISDNKLQFDNKAFKRFCIETIISSEVDPPTNDK